MNRPKLLTGAINHLSECRYGAMLYNAHDVYVGRSLALYGEYSEAEVELFRQIVRPGDTVLDIGANVGSHTLFFARAVTESGRVHAFEPQRIVFQTLCANMALNSITNAYCHLLALGETRCSMVVPATDYGRENNFGGLGLQAAAAGETVEVLPLDHLELPSCRFIKVDVEGMEQAVLRGAIRTIERHRPILYVENDRPANAQGLTGYIDSLGYEMYWHFPPLYNPHNYYQNPTNVFGNIVSGNLVCIHPALNITLSGFQRTYPGDAHPFAR